MKAILVSTSILLMASLLAGCGDDKKEDAAKAAAPVAAAPVATAPAAETPVTGTNGNQPAAEAPKADAAKVEPAAEAPKADAAKAEPAAEAPKADAAKAEPAAEAPKADAKKIDGEKVYNGLCMSCHNLGVAGSPKLDNKADWAPRIAKGKDALYTSALKGKNDVAGKVMPAKGGNPALSDDEVKAAVDYMVGKAK